MSHVVSVAIELNDLAAVRAACQRMGWTFCEGQQTFEWYGRWVGDYNAEDAAFKLGIKTDDYGKCDHAIKVPDATYEIGLVKQANGSFKPVWDFYGSGGLQDIQQENGMDGFMEAYSVEKIKIEMRKQGLKNVREMKDKSGCTKVVAET